MPKVHLRKKPISKNQHTWYLDFSPPIKNPKTGKMQRFEFLELHTYDKPADVWQRQHNTETKALMESVRSQRQLDIQNRKFGFLADRERHSSFAEFFEGIVRKKTSSECDNNAMALRYFIAFAGYSTKCSDIDEFLCEDYKNFMLSGPGISRRGRPIGRNTAVSYFAKFRTVLRSAFRKGLLAEDLFAKVDPIPPKETHREQLEIEEFQRLVEAPARSNLIKRAAIFAGLTGLRFSDVQTLRWSEVRGTVGKYHLQFVQEKTEGAEILPVSEQAIEILGERGDPDAKVFPNLSYANLKNCFVGWLKNADVQKNITFHSFRHTYATLQLEFGTELFTVSKLLGHKSIKTTLVYTKLKDKKKIEAAQRITLDLNKMT